MKIQYDIEARRQIGEIFKYGKVKFGTQTALKYKEKLREKINTLKQNPLIGNIEWMLTDEEHEYRFLLVKPYKIIYSVKGDIIRIHLFWHIHRNPDILKDYPIGVCEEASLWKYIIIYGFSSDQAKTR